MDFIEYGIIGGVFIVAILVLGFIMSRLYRRTTKGIALVKTGLGGQKVVKDGGIFTMPVFHELMPVNMNTMRLEINNTKEEALLTKDKMRVDVVVQFYLRVKQDKEAIAIAAQTLGEKTMDEVALKKLVDGKFTDALRAVAAQMQMEEMHENRNDFVSKVQTALNNDLEKNGLELESASLVKFNQTSIEYFDDANAFDVEGKRQLVEKIQAQLEQTNAIEKTTAVNIAAKDQEAAAATLAIKQKEKEAALNQDKAIQEAEATQEADIQMTQATKNQEAQDHSIAAKLKTDQAEIDAKLKIDKSQIEAEQSVNLDRVSQAKKESAAEIEKQKTLEMAVQQKNVEVAAKSEEVSSAEAKAEGARKDKVEAEQATLTAGKVAEAEREKTIEVLDAEKIAEKEAVGIKVAAKAELEAADNRAAAVLVVAEADSKKTILVAEAESKKIVLVAEANEVSFRVNAEGKEKMNAAENILSVEQVNAKVRLELITQLPSIIEQSAAPAKEIDSIKIIDAGSSLGGGEGVTTGNMVDKIRQNLQKYQAQSPLIKEILSEVGLDESMDVAGVFKQLKAVAGQVIETVKKNKDA